MVVSKSDDGGHTFEAHVIEDSASIGRPDIAFLSDGSWIVVSLSETNDNVELIARRFHTDGTPAERTAIATLSNDRSNGFPRIVSSSMGTFVTWTSSDEPAGIRVARVDVVERSGPSK